MTFESRAHEYTGPEWRPQGTMGLAATLELMHHRPSPTTPGESPVHVGTMYHLTGQPCKRRRLENASHRCLGWNQFRQQLREARNLCCALCTEHLETLQTPRDA